MSEFLFREAQEADVPAMAAIRAGDWGDEEFWKPRMVWKDIRQLASRSEE